MECGVFLPLENWKHQWPKRVNVGCLHLWSLCLVVWGGSGGWGVGGCGRRSRGGERYQE